MVEVLSDIVVRETTPLVSITGTELSLPTLHTTSLFVDVFANHSACLGTIKKVSGSGLLRNVMSFHRSSLSKSHTDFIVYYI